MVNLTIARNMGYNLYNQQGEDYRWTQTFWGRVLALAEKNGWKPKGTTFPKGYDKSDWDGNYWYNSGQIVEADDAANLANALEKSLASLPEEEIKIPKAEFSPDPVTHLPKITNWDNIPLENFFSGDGGRKSLMEFISFCRKGSFEIG